MQFEFDPQKSAVNKDKHGIDFVEAQALWLKGSGFHIPARDVAERRFAYIAALDGKLWTAIYTLRGDVVRLISVRRARKMEIMHHEDHNSRRI